MNRLYPIFLSLENKACLVVGAGAVALRKIQSLLESGARVRVVSPEADAGVLALAEAKDIALESREFTPSDLDMVFLVVAATDDESVNHLVWEEAERQAILCNVVDKPDLCNFHVPATVTRGDLKLAISTNGKCPALAGRLREMLEEQIGEGYAKAIERFSLLREEVRRTYPADPERRMAMLKSLAASDDLADALGSGDPQKLEAILNSWTYCLSD